MAKKPTSFKSIRQVKRAMKNFEKRHPDWKQYEVKMAELAIEMNKEGAPLGHQHLPMDVLLEKCYQAAKEMAKPLVEIARV